jgi:hypothetical protein
MVVSSCIEIGLQRVGEGEVSQKWAANGAVSACAGSECCTVGNVMFDFGYRVSRKARGTGAWLNTRTTFVTAAIKS